MRKKCQFCEEEIAIFVICQYLFVYTLYLYFHVSHHYIYMFLNYRYSDVKKTNVLKRALGSLSFFYYFFPFFLIFYVTGTFNIGKLRCWNLFSTALPILTHHRCRFFPLYFIRIFFSGILSLKSGNFNQQFPYLTTIE